MWEMIIRRITEYSRMAIDLALGRGGDQVVVKTRDKKYLILAEATVR